MNAHNYEHSMAITAKLIISGEGSSDPLDVVASFVGDECRGVSTPIDYGMGYHQVDMLTYSNEPGEIIRFRAYDASSGEMYDLAETVVFEVNGILGSALSPVMIHTEPPIPLKLHVSNNYPNPFNPVTEIRYGLPRESMVHIVIYNLAGQVVLELMHDIRPAGYHRVQWDGLDMSGKPVSSGVYFYSVTAGTNKKVGKMLLLK